MPVSLLCNVSRFTRCSATCTFLSAGKVGAVGGSLSALRVRKLHNALGSDCPCGTCTDEQLFLVAATDQQFTAPRRSYTAVVLKVDPR